MIYLARRLLTHKGPIPMGRQLAQFFVIIWSLVQLLFLGSIIGVLVLFLVFLLRGGV